jgi:hypothetical protein
MQLYAHKGHSLSLLPGTELNNSIQFLQIYSLSLLRFPNYLLVIRSWERGDNVATSDSEEARMLKEIIGCF